MVAPFLARAQHSKPASEPPPAHGAYEAAERDSEATGADDDDQPDDEGPSKVYEMRTYSVHPQHYPTFVALSNKFMHLRTAHSKLVFYGATELGGVNEVVHIWEYDSLEHRASVRAKLAVDADWMQQYISQARPCWASQTNVLLEPCYWAPVILPETRDKAPVYELVQRHMFASASRTWSDAWSDALQDAMSADPAVDCLVGAWVSTLGERDVVVELYKYASYAERDALVREQRTSEALAEALEELAVHVRKESARLLTPLPFSPCH